MNYDKLNFSNSRPYFAEGIKEKERSLVNKILPQISTLKDNCYHLRRNMWNDVNEDWPFYSEEEKRMLKRLVTSFMLDCTYFILSVHLE